MSDEQTFNFMKYMNVYKFETNLLGTGQKIVFKPITTGQMKELIQYQDLDDPFEIENVLDELIEQCVISPDDFKAEDLYIQDKEFLIYELRRKTKGNIFEFKHVCKDCNNESLQKIDLSNFEKKPLDENIKNVVKINENIKLKLRFLTRKEQKEILNIVDGMFKEEEKEIELKKDLDEYPNLKDKLQMKKAIEAGFLSNAYSIESIFSPSSSKSKKTLIEEKDVELFTKKELLESFSEQEFEHIKEWFDKYDFGVDFKFEIICPHCQSTEERELPVDSFFI